MEIFMQDQPDWGNILVLNLAKVFPDRNYKDPSYHAVCQQRCKENEEGEYVEIGFCGPIHNSWGNKDKIISMSDAQKGIQ